MLTVARRLYPHRRHEDMPRRRGDRAAEPYRADSEEAEYVHDFLRITSPHDPIQVRDCITA
jgi:hypothetical protein